MSYLKRKKSSLESSILNVWTEAAKKVDEKLVGGQKKLDKDKDGDIDGKDFAMLRKEKGKKKVNEVRYVVHTKKQGEKPVGVVSGKFFVKDAKDEKDAIKKAIAMSKPSGGALKGDEITAKDVVKVTKENYEVGTKQRRDHTIQTTPGQSKEDFEKQVAVMHQKKNSMREALAKMWGIEEKNNKNPFDNVKEKKYNDKKEGKTMTGKPETKVEVEPEVNEKKK